MSKFCEQCPLRYEISGDVDGIVVSQGEGSYERRAVMGRGALIDTYVGRMGVLTDENNNPSRPLKMPKGEDLEVFDRYEKKLDGCSGPTTEMRGFIKKREYIVGCPALGSIALPNTVAHHFLSQIRPELI